MGTGTMIEKHRWAEIVDSLYELMEATRGDI